MADNSRDASRTGLFLGRHWAVGCRISGDNSGHPQSGTLPAAQRGERCANRLEQWRGIATRFEKRAVNDRAAVVIVALAIWLEG